MKEQNTESRAPIAKVDSIPSKEKESKPFVLMFVDHSHLDYAWYRRRASSRRRERELLEEVRETLVEGKMPGFTLEQSVAGRELLEDLPQDRGEQFKKLCKEGKYELIGTEIQQEIFLGGGEVFFWNVNAGHDFWESMDAKPSKAFYQPDTFGVPRSFAKMLKHAGYNNFIYTRGHGDEIKTLGAVFNLESDDGSRVLAIPMQDGYGNASKLGRSRPADNLFGWENLRDRPELWNETAKEKLDKFLERYGDRFKQIGLPYVLMGSGSDFEDIDTDMPDILRYCEPALQQKYSDIKLVSGSFEQYVKSVQESVPAANLQTFSGELRSAAEQPVLRGIDSARIPLKQAAEKVEQQVYTADVILALSLLKAKQNKNMYMKHDLRDSVRTMNEIKRKLLPVYSHDAISGCGTDDVYSDMYSRLDDGWDGANQEKRNNLANLGGIEEKYSPTARYGETVSIVNPLNFTRRKLIELPLIRHEGLEHAQALTAETEDGHEIPVQLIEHGNKRYAAVAVDVDGFGTKKVSLKKAEAESNSVKKEKFEATSNVASKENRKEKKSIENEFYKVKVRKNGIVEIKDKESGKITYANMFEDVADRGDEYNFCPVENDRPITSEKAKAKVKITADGDVFSELQIDLTMPLPAEVSTDRQSRSEQTVPTPIRTSVRLTQGVDRVDFTTTLINNAKDHRLRAVFKTPNASETVRAKEPFEVIERPAVPVLGGEDWREPLPIATSHTQGLIAAGEVALFNKGLPEYEAIAGQNGKIEEVAVTLLRSVGWLSRDDLSTRKNSAGPVEPTPDAQCLGKQTFEYSLNMRGRESNAQLLQKLDDYRIDLERGPKDIDLQDVLKVTGEGVVVSAVAPSKDGENVILRLYNPNKTASQVNVDGIFTEAKRCNAREVMESEVDASNTLLKPGEIITLKLT